MMTRSPLLMIAPIALLCACAKNEPVDPNADANVDVPAISEATNAAADTAATPAAATVDFMGADNMARGTVTVADTPAGLTLTLAGVNLPMGQHGIHLHMTGKCDGPKFESAGSHLNPDNKKHGKDNPDGPHLGDLPNVNVAAGGTLNEVLTVQGVTMASLRDADGTALVIHAKADDNKTDPSGESGDRIACAVIAPAG